MAVVGIDLGGTKIASALFDYEGNIIKKDSVKIEGKKGKEVGKLIEEIILAYSNEKYIESIGVSVPGIYNSRNGRVWAPNIPGWEDYPLLEEIKNIGGISAEVRIESDRACYILGEVWKGAAAGCKNAIFLAVGTGIGAGILVNGEILRGANDIAGAIGWLALNRPFRQKYMSCGCFETHASGEGLAKMARQYLQEDTAYSGVLSDVSAEQITAYTIFDNRKDPICSRVLDEAVEFWGMAAANLVSLFNPEKIIFGGGVFGPASVLLPEIKREAEKWAQPISITKVDITTSSLGSDAGLLGAGYTAIRNLKTRV